MIDRDLERNIARDAPHCKDCKHGLLLSGGLYFCKRNKAYAAAERAYVLNAKILSRCGPDGMFWGKKDD